MTGIPGREAKKLKRTLTDLVGQPLAVRPTVPEDPLEAYIRITRRLEELETGNPYQQNFHRFVRDLVYTVDESGGGWVRKAPDWPFLKDLADAFIEESRVMVEKSRRVFASWYACAFGIWVAAGGQDPRWPQLMNAAENRQVYIVGQKFEASCYFLERRTRFIVNQLEERNVREHWPEFPRWLWKEGEANLSNGSRINAIAQGSHQLRGEAGTLVHVEELSFFEKAEQTIGALLPTIRGGGHVICITTPAAGTYAKKIRDGEIGGAKWD
jgi:phage FluMu gp28-like protein